MGKIMKKTLVGLVDKNTGEVTPIPQGKQGVYETSFEKTDDRLERADDLFFNTFGYYYHFFYGEIINMNLEPQMIIRLMRLACCLRLNGTGKVMFTERTPLKCTNEVLGRILKLKEKELKETKAYLIKNNLITINKNKEITISDKFIVKGQIRTKENTQNREVTRVFENGFIDLYSQCNPRSHKKLYNLILLLPYVNVEHNILCKNPEEKDFEKIQPLIWKELGECLGIDKSQVSKYKTSVWTLVINGHSCLMESSTVLGKVISINPTLFYRGRNPVRVEHLCSLFNLCDKVR